MIQPAPPMQKPAERVLVVDDDAGIRHSLARIIRVQGYDVDTAADGKSAIAAAKSFRPHLLIIDIRMPEIDGVEAFEQILDQHPGLPAIFMTANSSSSRISRAIEIGAVSVFTKPLDLQRLTELVDDVLSSKNP
jgi:DNA-binding NtrC family response regulator